MKYLASLILFLVITTHTFAAYGLTQSGNLVASTNSNFSRADDALLDITGASTVEVWIYYNSSIAAGTKDLVYKQETSGSFNGWRLYLDTAGTGLHFTSQATDKTVAWTPTTNTWYHVAATNSGAGTIKFYVNGVQQGADQTGFTNPAAGTNTLYIGADNGDTITNTNISLVRIWGVVRTEAELAAAKCSVLGATTNLNAEWTLDNTLNDNSGNSLTLTNNNVATFEAVLPSACATTFNNGTWWEF